MAYVVFELARHPECQESILADLPSTPDSTSTSPMASLPLTSESLRDAIHADSFIREVLRMKGEAITTVRSPRHDIELAGYLIPKGRTPSHYPQQQACLPQDRPSTNARNEPIGSLLHPMVYASNRSPDFATDPHTFDGMRWAQSRKLATTTGPGHLSFGLGRWACPGRFLAVAGEFCLFGCIPFF